MAQYVPEQKQQNVNQDHLKERVDLFISCKDLVQKDLNSKSDPFVVVYIRGRNGAFAEIGRTEAIKDNAFPVFATQFKMDYYFEEEQVIRLDVFDEDKKGSKKLKDHDFIGSATMVLGEIVHETGMTMSKKLLDRKKRQIKNKKSKKYSSITVTAEKAAEHGNAMVTLSFTMSGLPKMDGMFGKSDPYFTLSRTREDGKSLLVYKSQVIKSNLNPAFKPFQIETQKLCNCDPYRPIIITVYDWDKSGSDDLIGHIETNLNELSGKPKDMILRRKAKPQKAYGGVSVSTFSSSPLASFLDYMQGGAEVSLLVAVDFTGSNGHPKDAMSLHHIYGGKPSQYQQAIRQIGNIVSAYDFDKKFPVWGFGAYYNNKVYHDFALNWNEANPEVQGIYGVEQVYLNSITSEVFQLSGPTLFEPILTKAKACAQIAHGQAGLQYMILLILTDGIINDMKQTKNIIVEMANTNLPISIIIVGVGNADFSAMDELDGDDRGLMNSKGQYAKRDIVQFVPMRQYQNNLAMLSKQTLLEIPQQFLSYTRAHGIAPGQKKQVQVNQQQFVVSEDEMKQDQAELIHKSDSIYNVVADMFANAPLPPGREKGFDETGRPYYVNNTTQTTQWEHPAQTQQQQQGNKNAQGWQSF